MKARDRVRQRRRRHRRHVQWWYRRIMVEVLEKVAEEFGERWDAELERFQRQP